VDDPWVMYLVARKDVPLGRGQAMALAGAGAVRCADALASAPAWADAFAGWRPRPRKVALRASAEELAALGAGLDGVTVDAGGEPVLLCLPPRRRSGSEPGLAALRPYTDPPRGEAPAAPAQGPLLRYVVPAGVLRTTGKAMAQAGHAALECADVLADAAPAAFAAWRAVGCPGEVRRAGDGAWERLRAQALGGAGVVVSDAGLTQVAPGTETVAAFPPSDAVPEALAELEVLP
jgi:peptidyl-tRNA hydrolase